MPTYDVTGSLIAPKTRDVRNNVEVSIWLKSSAKAKLWVLAKYLVCSQTLMHLWCFLEFYLSCILLFW